MFPDKFTCDICGVETFGTNLCPDCLKTVSFNDFAVCPVCGRKTFRPEICLECKAQPPPYKRGVSALVYENGGAVLISKFKRGSAYLKEYFADLIAAKLRDFPRLDCIIYVPMTEKSKKSRGYNQTELLARALSERINVPVLLGAAVKIKQTAEQKNLSAKERIENLKGCFKIAEREKLAGKRVLVLDDVLTTGATAAELCRTALAAGAAEVYFACAASVEYKQPNG